MTLAYVEAVYRLEVEISATEVAVLAAIAAMCSDDGSCYYRQKYLAARVRLHADTIKAVLRALAAKGLIKKDVKRGDDGGNVASALQLTFTPANLGPTVRGRTPPTSGAHNPIPSGPDEPGGSGVVAPGQENLNLKGKETPVVPKGTGARKEPSAKAIEVAATIWAMTPDRSRKRSKPGHTQRAVQAALTAGATRAELVGSIAAYFRDPDISRQDYEFVQGVHRVIEGDKWRSWLPDANAEPSSDVGGKIDMPGEIKPELKAAMIEDYRERMRRWREEGRWERVFGHRPDEPMFNPPAFIRKALGI
jgi:hypothetical protein